MPSEHRLVWLKFLVVFPTRMVTYKPLELPALNWRWCEITAAFTFYELYFCVWKTLKWWLLEAWDLIFLNRCKTLIYRSCSEWYACYHVFIHICNCTVNGDPMCHVQFENLSKAFERNVLFLPVDFLSCHMERLFVVFLRGGATNAVSMRSSPFPKHWLVSFQCGCILLPTTTSALLSCVSKTTFISLHRGYYVKHSVWGNCSVSWK